MTGPTDPRARLAQQESIEEIRTLVARYCEGMDARSDEIFGSLWHADAVFEVGAGRGTFHGSDRIARFPREISGSIWSHTHHWTTNLVVTFDTEHVAHGRSDVRALSQTHGGEVKLIAGTYFDGYERRNGRWRFARRVLHRYFVSAATGVEILSLPPHDDRVTGRAV